ncbi:hypothetical protein [Streptomyces sp. NBC_01408]|uniref:hypothetical protein n=1 Tax=Streptomyces sp. NBC_01408 TaxID=2903855 RepID=UPI00225868F1|nr:hypothetical protein [Streptomyces sp. NBC_01408]MCX4695966.1 hypothetical protein [Streptomyces sp. NBC_01408]
MSGSAVPTVWFRLPPGFHDIGPADRDTLDAAAEALGSTEARQQLAQLVDGLDSLTRHHIVHTAIGLHPDEDAGIATSLFSLSVLHADQPNSRLAIARTALGIARSPLWRSTTRRFLDLPSKLPCCLVAGAISLPDVGQQLFQARIATVHPAGVHVIVLDLTSASVQHAELYIDILEAITHTVSSSDPEPGPAPAAPASRILEVLL